MKVSISQIPTNPALAPAVIKALSETLKKNPEWIDAITALVSFPLQSWAMYCRENIEIDPANIVSTLFGAGSRYFGFHVYENAGVQVNNLIVTEQIVSMTQEILENEDGLLSKAEKTVINAVHGTPCEDGKAGASIYMIRTHYQNAVGKICSEYAEHYSDLVSEIRSDPSSSETEIQFVFHNTSSLVELCPSLKMIRGESYNIDLRMAVNSLRKCIESLKTYPFNGNELYAVISRIADGASERAVSREMGKTLDYVRYRYAVGMSVLSALLWGYIPLNVICTSRKLADYK